MNTQSHVRKLYSHFAASCFLIILMFLGYVVKFYPNFLTGFDQSITRLIRSGYPNWSPFFLWITQFGNPLSIGVIFTAVMILFIYWKKYTEAIWLGTGVIGIAACLNPLLKLFFQRERPTLLHLVKEFTYSFPSGHATTSTILYGTLLLLVTVFIAQKWLQWTLRVIFICLILGICASRIYLGVHFPSDILAGLCEGLAWLCFSYPIFKEKQFIWRFKQKQR